MASFLVMLYDDQDAMAMWEALTPEEIERIMGEYGEWHDRLSARGLLVAGDKLVDGTGRVLRGKGDALRIADGPFSEAKEVVGGYFVLEAADLDAAAELARDCPHLEYGGMISIREIDPTDP